MNTERFEHIIEFIEDEELSDWEKGFIESIKGWWDDRGFLTDGQADKLEEIYAGRQ